MRVREARFMAKDTTFVLRRTNDYFFKYVFGSEEGTDVLIDFLNATQNRPNVMNLICNKKGMAKK